MFKLLPWTEGKYHILMEGEVIGHTEFDESLLVNLSGLMEADEIREMLDAVEEQYSTMMMVKLTGLPKTSKNAQKKLNKKAALKVKKETTPKKMSKGKPAKKEAGNGVVKNPRGSKWDKYMDGKEHVLTLKQTGVAKIETARVAVATYAKSRGYTVTTTVAGDKLTIKKV